VGGQNPKIFRRYALRYFLTPTIYSRSEPLGPTSKGRGGEGTKGGGRKGRKGKVGEGRRKGRGGKGRGREGKGRREERERAGRLLFQTFLGPGS